MSQRHCTFARGGGGIVTVTDSSTNGTYLNGVRLAAGVPAPLQSGDVITLLQPPPAPFGWRVAVYTPFGRRVAVAGAFWYSSPTAQVVDEREGYFSIASLL